MQTLHSLLTSPGPQLDFDAVADFSLQIASGLQALHSLSMVHMELSPQAMNGQMTNTSGRNNPFPINLAEIRMVRFSFVYCEMTD